MPAPDLICMTLEGVSSFVLDHEELKLQTRREITSSLRTFARIVGKSPADIIADPTVIRDLLANAPWQLANLSKARWANIRSHVSRALQLAGVRVDRQRRNYKLSPDWGDLLAPLERRDRDELRRFAGWCSVHGIVPAKVDTQTFEGFRQYMMAQSIQRNPRERAHVARRAWNRVLAVDGRGYPTIPAPAAIRERAMALSELPESLVNELQHYRAWALAGDQIENDRKPLKPVTVDGYITRMRVLLTTLIRSGVPVSQFASLADCITPATVKKGMNAWIGGNELDDKARQNLHSMVVAALSMARYIAMDEADIAELRKLAKKVRFVARGMCAKNKSRLKPLYHADVRLRLLRLPLEVRKSLATVKQPTVRQAQRMQLATLLEILLKFPLRIRNAAELDFSSTISRPVAGLTGNWRISIPDYDVKNNVALEAELGPTTSQFLADYIYIFRPALAKGNSPRIFLTQHGTPIGSSALSKQLARFVRRETGIVIHAHLMRHLAAHLYLVAHPGDYESVRKMLGHKNIETTIRFYASLSAEQAVGVYDDLVEKLRNDHKAAKTMSAGNGGNGQ